MSSVLSPLFKFSIYLLFSLLSSKLPADALSGRLCLAQQRAHQTSTHITSIGQKLDTAAAHTQAGLCLLPCSHTLPERTNQRTVPGHSHPLAHLHRFSFTVRKMKKILPISKALTKLSCSSVPSIVHSRHSLLLPPTFAPAKSCQHLSVPWTPEFMCKLKPP